jgi:ATP-dependent Clp protease protease subunit
MGVNNLTVFHTYFIHIIGNLKGLNKTLFLYLKNHTMISTEEFRKYAIKHQGISSLTTDQYISSIENMTPYIIEERPMNITQMDVFSRLMKDRIIFMGTGVDDNVANIITAQLLFLESIDAKSDITMYINSPGGSVYAGLGIYDTMQYVNPDVATICTGLAASMGAVLLTAGTTGKRSALKHSRVMIHQPLGGAQGQASDIAITAKQIQILKEELYEILSVHSGKSMEEIEKDADRDYWMIAEDAKKYGLIDEVLFKK